MYKFQNIRMVNPKYAHICSPTFSTLLNFICSGVKNSHKGNRARGCSFTCLNNRPGRPKAAKSKSSSATRLMNQGLPFYSIKYSDQRILNRQDKAGGILKAIICAGVHESRRI